MTQGREIQGGIAHSSQPEHCQRAALLKNAASSAGLRFLALRGSQSFPNLPAAVAEIPIQRRKPPLSPWLLVALAAVALTLGAYWFLRPAPADEPGLPAAAPAVGSIPVAPSDSLAADTAALLSSGPEAGPRASAARTDLLQLVSPMSALADRADLRDDATVREQRDNLTSATARLAGDAHASLRPGVVAAANLLRAIQQKAYPALEEEAGRLVQQASQLPGRDGTAAEQQQNRRFLRAAAALLQAENAPPIP